MSRLNQPIDRTGSPYVSINPYYINVPQQQENISKKIDQNEYVPGTPSNKFNVLTNRQTMFPHYRKDIVPNSHLYPNIKTTYMTEKEDTYKTSRLLNGMDHTPFYIGMKRYERTSLPYKMPAQGQ
jgi:L-asparaginase II